MKSLRLLPIVIFAALALLLFKGIGILSNGGYVLTGAPPAVATEAAADAHGGEAADAALPQDMTIADISPTLGDTAPTLAIKPEAADAHGAPAESGHGEPASSESSAEGHGDGEAAHDVPDIACPDAGPSSSEAPAHDGGLTDTIGNALVTSCPSVEIPVNEYGDAVPTTKDGNGAIVPLAEVAGDTSEAAVLERLSLRRAELDQFAADLEMRAALVEAAEKRMAERTTQMQELEEEIAALVDQKQAEEDAQFKAVVSMYETMKPKDAAKIFNAIEINVLLRVARAMSPRKMAPVLAAMNAQRAQELTAAMATDRPPPLVAETGEDLGNLPQIVGQ